MADWTVVAAAGIAGLAGVGGSALAQVASGRAARRQRIEDRREAALERRRAAYSGLLETFDRQSVMARFGEPTEETWGEWRRDYGKQISLVRLHSSEDVRACAEALHDALGRTGAAFAETNMEHPFHLRLHAVWQEHHDDLESAWRALLAAMRVDVATSASE